MSKKNVLLGVSGGIAAYKAANITSMLNKRGYNVKVIMTENATQIITPLTLETLSKNKVLVDMWEPKSNIEVDHIAVAEWADIVLVAPATYNIVGKVSNGIADDMLSTVISATKAPVYFALAMNVNMYNNPVLRENINKLKKYGYKFIEADEGFLACNINAKGRLKKEEDIIEIIEKEFEEKNNLLLKGKKVLITAGRTEEPLDPIRYLSNSSTGKMGYAIAEEAKKQGAKVTLVAGPNSQPDIEGVNIIKVKTAVEMYNEVLKVYDEQDIMIATAAVADYRPKYKSDQKIKKKDGELTIELERNPDILFEMGQRKTKQLLIGFCAESENLIENALGKLERKNLDLIVANDVKYFASNNNQVYFIDKSGNQETLNEMPKDGIAKKLIEKVKDKL